MRSSVQSFYERLKKIGISVELSGNFPWVYLYKINGVLVKERFKATHGFCCFYQSTSREGKDRFSDRREVFKTVRKYVEENK